MATDPVTAWQVGDGAGTLGEFVKTSVVAGGTAVGTTHPVLAQPSAFLNAVAFALTGSDAASMRAVDQANCVSMVNPKTENGRLVGEVFHLNNVQIDRISIQPWRNIAGRWIQVELRGGSTIYEYTGAISQSMNWPGPFAERTIPLLRCSRSAIPTRLTISLCPIGDDPN